MSVTSSLVIEFPEGFVDFAWEVEAKGWLQGTVAVISGRRYRVVFYDPTRLAQDIVEELTESAVFHEPNLLVVPTVTRAHMEAAIETVAKTGRHLSMTSEDERDPSP